MKKKDNCSGMKKKILKTLYERGCWSKKTAISESELMSLLCNVDTRTDKIPLKSRCKKK